MACGLREAQSLTHCFRFVLLTIISAWKMHWGNPWRYRVPLCRSSVHGASSAPAASIGDGLRLHGWRPRLSQHTVNEALMYESMARDATSQQGSECKRNVTSLTNRITMRSGRAAASKPRAYRPYWRKTETSPNVLHQDAHGESVHVVLPVDRGRFFGVAMRCSGVGGFHIIVVLQLADLAVVRRLVGSNGSRHEQVSGGSCSH
jgi:hypothetical protein